MSDLASRMAQLSPEKQALLKRRLAAAATPAPASPTAANAEPLAIVGIGCRFPGGANSPESFWRMIWDGVDAIQEIPANRWPVDAYYDQDQSRPGRMNTRWGAFLDQVDEFDAPFFGLSHEETSKMDPQQRLVLEVCWEAFEDAGQTLEDLAGSRTGVYVGTHVNDYAWMVLGDPSAISAYDSTGTAHSIVANRVSYLFDLHGPSLAIDTACSSGLTAVHLACQGLRQGECDLAVACGVNLLLTPTWSLALTKMGMLSPGGRCRSFDAGADGIVRGEGCGAIVLKRLSKAIADGDAIWAVVRGSAANQDGRTNGLTAPNGLAKQEVVRAALANGGVAPESISAIEAQGTGTKLGDSIEVESLAEVLGRGDAATNPCVLGSVKTNIGHSEGAAGIAAIIKLALALHHEGLPALLHFKKPNPLLPLDGTRFVLPATRLPWPRSARPRLGGVSAFGFGGANAHVVLEEAPTAAAMLADSANGSHALVLSAHSVAALYERTRRMKSWLEGPGRDVAVSTICHTAWARRSRHEHGLCIAGATHAELAARLDAALRDAPAPGLARVRRASDRPPGLVFAFTGPGAPWSGNILRLHATEPAFREALATCDAAIVGQAGSSVLRELERPTADARFDSLEVALPVAFAIQVALAAWWRSLGITPDAVVGQGAGEIAAAHAAGILSLDEAARVIVHYARLLERTRTAGNHAAPSEPQCAEFSAALGAVTRQTICVPLASIVSGAFATGSDFDADYWVRNARGHNRLREAIDALGERGHRTFIEIGSERFLLDPVEARAAAWPDSPAVTLLPSLVRDFDAAATLRCAAGAIHLLGHACTLSALWPARPAAVRLPIYPWQRERFPLPDGSAALGASQARRGTVSSAGNDIWRTTVTAAGGTHLCEAEMTAAHPTGVTDHRIHGTVAMPAVGMVALMLESAARAFGPGQHAIEGMEIREALVLGETPRVVQISLTPTLPGTIETRMCSRSNEPVSGPVSWTIHAIATVLLGGAPDDSTPRADLTGLRSIGASAVRRTEAFYHEMAARGLNYGPAFRAVAEFRSDALSGFAALRSDARLHWGTGEGLPVDVLDASLQTLVALAPTADQTWVPVRIGRITVRQKIPDNEPVLVHTTRRPATDGATTFAGDVRIFSNAGIELVVFEDVSLQNLDTGATRPIADWLYELEWQPCPQTGCAGSPASQSQQPAGTRPAPGRWLIFHDRAGTADRLAADLRQRGAEVHSVRTGQSYASSPHGYTIRPDEKADFATLFDQLDAVHGAPISGIAYLWTLDVTAATAPAAAHPLTSDAPTLLSQAIATRQARAGRAICDTRFWIVTRGAQPAGGAAVVAPLAATAWGLGRVIATEYPGMQCSLVDLSADAETDEALSGELLAHDGANQVCLRKSGRFEARLARSAAPSAPASGETMAVPAHHAWRLFTRKPGTLEALEFRAVARHRPARGEVEIRVETSALNFRDVFVALGLLPDPELLLGLEAAGVITAVGSDVSGFSVGDAVMAFADGAFGSFVTVPAARVAHRPKGVSAETAAGIPVAFLTAHHALHHLAGIGSGESVLIHAASGGVGQAAVQLALRAGATVFGSAGSPHKRELLRTLGVQHVLDSRSLGFADEILRLTAGRGVDIVLNSLAGDFIERSFAALASDGRFIEIGKTGIWSQERVRVMRPNARYHIFDLIEVSRREPGRIRDMLTELVRRFDSGDLHPLPVELFSAEETADAFRHMSQARHVGKIVVTQAGAGTTRPARARAHGRHRWSPKPVTHLVTGGLAGRGLVLAEWLAAHGVRQLVLMDHRQPGEHEASRIRALERAGVRVLCVCGDVSVADDAQAALDQAAAALPPIGAVFHCPEGLAAGLPGALHLDRLTRHLPITKFVLFSSCASMFGPAGQATEAAAAAGLDALAHARRAQGCPAQSIAWGAWSETRTAGKNGLGSLSPVEALLALETLLEIDTTQIAVVPFEAGKWTANAPATSHSRLFERLHTRTPVEPAATTAGADAPARIDVREQLAAAASDRQRLRVMETWLRGQAAMALRLPAARVDIGQPLKSLGFDSLLAVEFRNRLELDLHLKLPATLLWNYPNISLLAGHLLERLHSNPPAPAAAPAAVAIEAGVTLDAAVVATLSDAEAEQQLEQRLRDLERNF